MVPLSSQDCCISSYWWLLQVPWVHLCLEVPRVPWVPQSQGVPKALLVAHHLHQEEVPILE